MEIVQSYFISCVDVEDPEIVFTGFVPTEDRIRTYGGIALSEDAAGFSSDKDVAIALRKMFTTALEVPKEEFQIDEQIHVPGREVSEEGPGRAFIGYVVRSIVNNQVTKRRVNLPLDALVRHCLILGTTRSGKSMLAYILIREALATGVKVVVFDPHGSIVNRLRAHPNLKTYRVSGSITNKLREIYDAASQWKETNKLRLLVVLDETSLLKAKNLVDCLNELGKRGVSFCLSTQYSTSIPPPARNVGTYFILSSMTEVEMQRFHEVTLHPSSKLISRLPRATSFVFSPYWVGDPFFVRHRTVS
ncbi:MAG: helicase HerA domain-containing protein, partial [Candidatus Geothermarchaeales archaeon]